MLKKLMAILLPVLLTSFMCTALTPHPLAATPPVNVYVNPPEILNQTMVPNTTFNVSVKIANVLPSQELVAVEFELRWNASVLNCIGLQEILFHTVTPSVNWTNIWNLGLSYDSSSGYAHYAQTWLSLDQAVADGYAPISGNQTVATLAFKVKDVGKCAFHFTTVKLSDINGNPVPCTTADGFFSNAPPPPPALLYVDPPKISNISLTPGYDFDVNVSMINASGVYVLQFALGFNASMVKANTVTLGSLIPPSATPTTQIDNTTGFVMFNVSLSSSLDGNGTLIVISFHVEGLGGTTLHLYDVQLLDLFGQQLPYTTSDGSFDNVLLAKLAIDPPEIIDPTLLPPATFMVNVTIAEVRDMYGYEFNLTFNPKILVCLQVQVNDVLNETNYTPNQIIDNTVGFIKINVTYYPPAVPLDVDLPTPLVSIKFRVKAMGGTNLTLTDTELVDSMGQSITHEVYNGYFQSLIVDIGVLDLFASPTEFYKRQGTNITCVVTNEGNSTQSFILNIYYNSTLLTAVNVAGLASNMNATITIVWNTTSVQYGKYILSAQVPTLPYETHIADNNLTDGIIMVKIPGDLNGDGRVDIYDAILLAKAYGSTPELPVIWNPAADINGDGVVDIYDAILLAGNFGKTI